jgi:glucokinase
MGNFLVPWIKNFDASVIVIGGNIAGSFHLFGNEMKAALSKNNLNIDVYLSDLKENAAIIGSARLLVDDYYISVKDLLSKM